MADVKISELLNMQHTLAEKKGWLCDRTPERAPMSILWAIDELGEAIAIIKKKGSGAIMDNQSVREHSLGSSFRNLKHGIFSFIIL